MNDIIEFANKAEFAKWLQSNEKQSKGVWLRLAKKGAVSPTVTYAEAIDVALCYGWIDGQKKPDNTEYWLQRFTPRTAKSIWSKINQTKVIALIESGAMKPSGLQEIERAKKDGRWARAYAGAKTISIPPDLQKALDQNPEAHAFFKTLNSQNRYAILFRIGNVVKAETRAKKITQFVEMLEQGRTIYR